MWVKSEYAGELAVLSAWLSALLPWNVQLAEYPIGSSLYVRFPLFQVQFSWFPGYTVNGEFREFQQTGFRIISGVWAADPITAARAPAGLGRNITGMPIAWTVGALVIAVALLLSVSLYFDEEEVEDLLPVDPVRLMGGLLGVGAVALAAGTALLWNDIRGIPFPVGVVVLVVLSATLLTVERTETPESVDPDPDADES